MPLTPQDAALVAKAVWSAPEHDVNPDGTPASADHPAAQWLTSIRDVSNAAAKLQTEVDALQAQVTKLSVAGVDPVAVAQAVLDEIRKAVAK